MNEERNVLGDKIKSMEKLRITIWISSKHQLELGLSIDEECIAEVLIQRGGVGLFLSFFKF